MKVIFGIGNPGIAYENTRHNIGFKIIDEFASRYGLRCEPVHVGFGKRLKSWITLGRIQLDYSTGTEARSEEFLLVKPQTFVNLSGDAVSEILSRYEFDIGDLIVVCDDFHLPIGKIRIRRRGSSGGHKGLKSIASSLGTTDFARLRFGIGQGDQGKYSDMKDFVLSPFEKSEIEIVESTVIDSVAALDIWLKLGIDECMNRFN